MLRNRSVSTMAGGVTATSTATSTATAIAIAFAFAFACTLLPQGLVAQSGPILASEIRVTPQEATLSLERVDNTTVSITLRDGRLLSDGAPLGTFVPGGELDRAWRALLGQALNTEPSALAGLLGGWGPPQGLAAADQQASTALTGVLAELLDQSLEQPSAQRPQVGQEPLVEFLLENPEAAARIQRLINRSPSELQWWIGGDRVLPEGTRLEGSLAVLGGNLELNGTLGGDLIMFQGDVRLGPRAQVEGDLRIDGGLIRGSTQGVEGRVQRITSATALEQETGTADTRSAEPATMSEFRRGFQAGWDAGDERPRASSRSSGPLHTFFNGLGNLLRTGVSFLILLGLGLGALYFFPRPFEVVTRTSQVSFWRSLVVGWAALVLSPFVWITGLVLLVVTIIGIPVALLWIPAFWMALALALLFGTLAVSRMMGAWWVGRSGLPIPRGMDPDKPAVQLGIGAILLLMAPAAAAVFQMAGSFFQIFQILVAVVGGVLAANVMALGLGAVLLSRGGRNGRWTNGLDDLTLSLDEELFTSEASGARD